MNKTVKKNNALLTNVSFISVTIHSVCHVEIKVSKYGLYITLRYNHVYVCNNDVDHHAFFNYMPIFILYILYTVESVLHVSRFCKDSYQQTTEISKKSIWQGPSKRLSCVDQCFHGYPDVICNCRGGNIFQRRIQSPVTREEFCRYYLNETLVYACSFCIYNIYISAVTWLGLF